MFRKTDAGFSLVCEGCKGESEVFETQAELIKDVRGRGWSVLIDRQLCPGCSRVDDLDDLFGALIRAKEAADRLSQSFHLAKPKRTAPPGLFGPLSPSSGPQGNPKPPNEAGPPPRPPANVPAPPVEMRVDGGPSYSLGQCEIKIGGHKLEPAEFEFESEPVPKPSGLRGKIGSWVDFDWQPFKAEWFRPTRLTNEQLDEIAAKTIPNLRTVTVEAVCQNCNAEFKADAKVFTDRNNVEYVKDPPGALCEGCKLTHAEQWLADIEKETGLTHKDFDLTPAGNFRCVWPERVNSRLVNMICQKCKDVFLTRVRTRIDRNNVERWVDVPQRHCEKCSESTE